jgi:hypothetical protein
MTVSDLIVTALVAGVAAYLGSYLKKKGENLATHEDIDKLVSQVSAVTAATKQIESQIRSSCWFIASISIMNCDMWVYTFCPVECKQ